MSLLNITDDPQQLGLLSLGLRLMSTPGKFGTALGTAGLGALGDMQGAVSAQDRRKQQELQRQMLEMQMQQAKEKQERERAIAEAYRGAIRTPEQVAMGENGGPTVAAANAVPNAQPTLDQSALIRNLLNADPMAAAQMLQPKPADYKVVGDALVAVTPGGVKEAYRAPAKPDKLPEQWQLYQLSGAADRGIPFDEWNRMNKRAGASSVSLSTGPQVPPAVLKQQDEIIDRMTTARSIDADLGAIQETIKSGTLKFGPIRNLVNTGKNVAGVSDEESRAFGTFKSTLEKLRNDSLRLNTGVQTEGDAQRAWNELFQNINDTKFVEQRLSEIRKINQRAAELQNYRLSVLRQNFSAPNLPTPNVPPALDTPKVRRFNPQTGKIE